ncbi:MAG: hypothetical protein Sylvanvirus10_19 [Sylvanvirus sp.]|uniref:Uncharacterized protein n=1 Tax=Sylvanvirus sp. TaxID=2487774 RepID=A0A3G5AHX5_9VIRU|nr:MAG: hypothetical protein Sylvanvirus10_19 [Sylvanvirus sp.]
MYNVICTHEIDSPTQHTDMCDRCERAQKYVIKFLKSVNTNFMCPMEKEELEDLRQLILFRFTDIHSWVMEMKHDLNGWVAREQAELWYESMPFHISEQEKEVYLDKYKIIVQQAIDQGNVMALGDSATRLHWYPKHQFDERTMFTEIMERAIEWKNCPRALNAVATQLQGRDPLKTIRYFVRAIRGGNMYSQMNLDSHLRHKYDMNDVSRKVFIELLVEYQEQIDMFKHLKLQDMSQEGSIENIVQSFLLK